METREKQNDHDRLICVDTKLGQLIKNFENHLSHHFKYSFYAFTVSIGTIITLIVLLLTK